jgi:hypothetical protein
LDVTTEAAESIAIKGREFRNGRKSWGGGSSRVVVVVVTGTGTFRMGRSEWARMVAGTGRDG